MSLHNFWNNFTHGFMHGMFNSNPFFGCFGGCYANPFMFNSCFMPYSWNSNLYLYPNVMSTGSFYPLMNNITPPSFPAVELPEFKLPDNIWETQTGNTNFNTTNWTMPNNMWQTPWSFNNTSSLSSSRSSENSEDSAPITYGAAELKKTWSSKKKGLSDAFYNKVVEVAKKVKCSPNDLMALMYSESGIDPSRTNSNGGATGLIQFMPKTAESLGTTTEKLKKMSAVEQMDYVEKCLLQSKKMAGYKDSDTLSAGSLYAITFLPAYAKNEVLTTKNDKYYAPNKGLDKNKDGKITKSELDSRLKGYYA